MSGNQTDVAAIEHLEERRYAAMLAADTGTLEELLHDALVYMHSTGGADTKESYITGVRDGAFAYKAVERDDQTVRVHGDIGLVFNHRSEEHTSELQSLKRNSYA